MIAHVVTSTFVAASEAGTMASMADGESPAIGGLVGVGAVFEPSVKKAV